jgi:hypothetical protein
MAGRSKECGKAVADLTGEELRREKRRCEGFIRTVTKGPAVKDIRKRLLEINKRMARDG